MFKEVVKFMVYDKLVVNESRRPKCKRTRPRNWARLKPATNEVNSVLNSIIKYELDTVLKFMNFSTT